MPAGTSVTFCISCVLLLICTVSYTAFFPMEIQAKSPPFRHPKVVLDLSKECVVKSAEERAMLPTCSHDVLREYFKMAQDLPECGHWIGTKGAGFAQRYDIDFCQLQPFNWQECSAKKGIKHLLMMGDSTGWRLFMGLLNTTIAMGGSCQATKEETQTKKYVPYMPSKEYFSLGIKNLRDALHVKKRGCGQCPASIYDCELRSNFKAGKEWLRLEFIPNALFNEKALTTPTGALTNNSGQAIHRTESTGEFIFRNYLSLGRMPDTIMIHFPLPHEKKHNASTLQDFKHFLRLVIDNIPRSTRVHWIPSELEFVQKRPKSVKGNRYGPDKLSVKEWMYVHNRKLFSELMPYITDPYFNMFGFINTLNMSQAKLKWNLDGAHFNNSWYMHLVKVLLSMLCGDLY